MMQLFSKHETRRQLLRGFQAQEMVHIMVARWLQTPLGVKVLEAEKSMTSPLLERLFGHHILQIGCNEEYSLIENSPARHKLIFAPSWRPGCRNPVADIEELPLATDSIDVVVLHHALDFADDSHRLLREATRVLRPGGQMLIIGFNPVSCWGLSKLFRRNTAIPWRGRFLSKRRLSDWLQLLNLHTQALHHGLHFLPLAYSSLLQHADSMEKFGVRTGSPLGGAYVYLCVKQVVPITPIMPRWRPLSARPVVMPASETARVKMH
ncbi:MAG: methyltransferase domain-containing protein [Gammaproteobacteria bacterium]|nr:methyltransferase domain-containing protein [Gammaproteobacteria bacterium]MCY4358459.1 methyltransferase domain-containing protein [Gammaproteobacteria bacterium]